MTYDYKRLCNELLSYLYQCNWPDGERFYALVERARAALVEPEPKEPAKTDWVQRAGQAKLEAKVQAIFDAYCTLADLRDRSVSDGEMLAAALREVINQCQNGQGMLSAPELLRIATQLDVAEDDIDLFQAQ
jgi:hypothetical protein